MAATAPGAQNSPRIEDSLSPVLSSRVCMKATVGKAAWGGRRVTPGLWGAPEEFGFHPGVTGGHQTPLLWGLGWSSVFSFL